MKNRSRQNQQASKRTNPKARPQTPASRHYLVNVLEWEPNAKLVSGSDLALDQQISIFTRGNEWRLPTVGEFNQSYDSDKEAFPHQRYWATDECGRVVILTKGTFITPLSRQQLGCCYQQLVRFALSGLHSTTEGGALVGVSLDMR